LSLTVKQDSYERGGITVEKVCRVDEADVVLAFLRAEFASERFGRHYASFGADPSLVNDADTANAEQNAARRMLLGKVRGFGVNALLFTGFPTSVEWWRIRLTVEELGRTLYARHPTWIRLSEGPRLVSRGAQNVNSIPTDENANANVRAVASRVEAGEAFPEIIMAARDPEKKTVIVEGHTRATAYVLALPDEEKVDAFLGIADGVAAWDFW
jgi:hypothetical protein